MEQNVIGELDKVGFGMRMTDLNCGGDSGVMNSQDYSSPLENDIVIECRFRLKSAAFDSFWIASESFSDYKRRRFTPNS